MPFELLLPFMIWAFVLVVGPPALLLALKLMGFQVRFDLESWFGALLLILFLGCDAAPQATGRRGPGERGSVRTEVYERFTLSVGDGRCINLTPAECEAGGAWSVYSLWDRRPGMDGTRIFLDGRQVARNELLRSTSGGRALAEVDIDYRRYGHVVEARFFTRR